MEASSQTPLSSIPSPLYRELMTILSRWLLWYRFRRGMSWAQTGAVIGLGGSLGLAAFLVWRGDWVRQEFIWALLAGMGGGILVAGLLGILWPTDRTRAAQFFDIRFGLRERLSTALELSGSQPSPFTSAEVFVSRQLEDTLAAARAIQPHHRLPLLWHRIQAGLFVALLGATILFYARGDTYFNLAAHRRTVQQAIQQQTKQIEELRSQIEQNPKLTPEQRQKLTQPLDEAIQKLQEAQSAESAASALNETTQKLQTIDSPQTSQMSQALKDAGKNLAQQEGSPLQETGQSLAQGDPGQAAQNLANLNPGALTPEQSQALAGQLEGMAESLQSSNPDLANQLNQAAQALKKGDSQAAAQALKNAAQSLANAGQQIAEAQAAGQAAGQIAQGQKQVMQAGSGSQGQSGQGQGNQAPGQGQGGSGQGAGQGSSNQSGQGSGSGGAGRGEGGGNTQPGREAGNNPIQQGNGPGDAGEKAYDPIYTPQHLGGSDQNPVTLPGSDQPGSQVTGQGNVAPGASTGSTVPYTQALPAYTDAYRQAIENGTVPSYLRSLVKQYFISLQP